MGCPVTPLSCLNPSVLFAGIYNSNCGGFADPSKYSAERLVFKSVLTEQINNYGVDVNYYINGFNLEECNILYGEHPTQEYSSPYVIRAIPELEESVSLSIHGMESGDDLILYIPIDAFTEMFIQYLASETDMILTDEHGVPLSRDTVILNFHAIHGQRIEPKSDDLIELTSLGCDRPGDRGSKIFRITEALDQHISSGINPLMGHYVYKIHAVRFEPSNETNYPIERGNSQIYDNTIAGKVESTIYPSLTTDIKVYNSNVDDISKDVIYNMNVNDTSVYGDYY